jgi:CMP-N-acetylneuraminic acid synthetase
MLKDDLYIVSIIPARSGSKGVINKNLRKLNGVELLNWSISASLKTPQVNRTIVSTDSREYAEIAIKNGAEAPFIRPRNISQDTSTDLEMILHSLEFFKSEEKIPDLILHLRPTSPLRNPKKIIESIEVAASNKNKITALRSIQEMSETSYKSFEIGENGKLISAFTHLDDLENSNLIRQAFPKTYLANGYVDILFPEFILGSQKIHGNSVMPFLTENIIEVDSEFDLQQLESMEESFHTYSNYLFGA